MISDLGALLLLTAKGPVKRDGLKSAEQLRLKVNKSSVWRTTQLETPFSISATISHFWCQEVTKIV
jgi:hypothetical protein